MAFDFKLSLSVSSSPKVPEKTGGRFSMSKWAQQVAEKLKREENEAKRKENLEQQRRSQILAGAPHFWDSLKQCLREEGNELRKLKPGHLTVDDIPGLDTVNTFVKSPRGRMEVTFDSAVPLIKFSIEPVRKGSGLTIGDLNGSLSFTVSDEGGAVAVTDTNGESHDPQGAAEYLLNIMI
jgi:hypothetical protein